jgi:hypothetical protein
LGTCLFLAVGLMGVYNFTQMHSAMSDNYAASQVAAKGAASSVVEAAKGQAAALKARVLESKPAGNEHPRLSALEAAGKVVKPEDVVAAAVAHGGGAGGAPVLLGGGPRLYKQPCDLIKDHAVCCQAVDSRPAMEGDCTPLLGYEAPCAAASFVKQHSDASGQPVRLHPEGVEALSCSDPRVWDGSSQQAMLAAAKDVMVEPGTHSQEELDAVLQAVPAHAVQPHPVTPMASFSCTDPPEEQKTWFLVRCLTNMCSTARNTRKFHRSISWNKQPRPLGLQRASIDPCGRGSERTRSPLFCSR